MDGIREDTLENKPNPDGAYKVRALDAAGKSVVIPFSAFNPLVPQEDDIKEFLVDSTRIVKKRYSNGQWIEVGIETEI